MHLGDFSNHNTAVRVSVFRNHSIWRLDHLLWEPFNFFIFENIDAVFLPAAIMNVNGKKKRLRHKMELYIHGVGVT